MSNFQADAVNEKYHDYIVPNNPKFLKHINDRFPVHCTDIADQNFNIIYLENDSILQNPITTQLAVPILYTLMENPPPLDQKSKESSSNIPTYKAASSIRSHPQLGGQGAMIGFIDTGIDYRNPLFQNTDGTTRILGIWDQTIAQTKEKQLCSPHSKGFNPVSYGVAYEEHDINEALRSENPLALVASQDDIGHGTFMSGIAAGNDWAQENFSGTAPDCFLGVVKLKPAKRYLRSHYCIPDDAIAYQENDIMMGIAYLEFLASRYHLPLVIYIGLGTNYGGHEGSSPLCTMLKRINNQVGITTVLPAGNEAGLQHHYFGKIEENQVYDDVEISVGAEEKGFVTELWASQADLYTVGFVSPSGQEIRRIAITSTSSSSSFSVEGTQITVIYSLSEYGSGSQQILIRFVNPVLGLWRIRVYSNLFITGDYHMWLPVGGFVSPNTYFLNSNPTTIITEPGNLYIPITVGTYDEHKKQLDIHSCRGNNRRNSIKPELVASGVEVSGPGIPATSSATKFPMIRKSGSSVAAAHVAGAAATLLAWGIVGGNNHCMTNFHIKTALTRGASRLPAYDYPNKEWGYGVLDLEKTHRSLNNNSLLEYEYL